MPSIRPDIPAVQKKEPVLFFSTIEEWEGWLAENYTASTAIWICYAKKDTGIPSLTYPEAVDGALCWGWIDGQVASLDRQFYLQRFTRRRTKSRWSQVNVGKVAALLAAGRMQQPGLDEVSAAQADGRWNAAYASPSNITVPEDFQQALDQNPKALSAFLALRSQDRYSILYRIHEAKRPETRARRIAKFLSMLADGTGIL